MSRSLFAGSFEKQPLDCLGIEQNRPAGFQVWNPPALRFLPQPLGRDAQHAGHGAGWNQLCRCFSHGPDYKGPSSEERLHRDCAGTTSE